MGLVGIGYGVVDVEFAGGGDEVGDAGDFLEGGVVVDDDFAGLAGLAGVTPDADPHLGALAVVLEMDGAAVGRGFPALVYFVGFFLVDDADRARQGRVGVESHVHPDPLAVGMGLDEQAAGAGQRGGADDLPGAVGMALGVGADAHDAAVTKVRGAPHRAEVGVDPVGAAAGMGNLAGVHQLFKLAVHQVDDGDFVGIVGSHHEVTLGRVQAAVVQEALSLDHLDGRVDDIGIIHNPHLAGFLDVHHPFGLVMRGQDGGHARLGVIFLGVVGVAAGADDLEGLEGLPIEDGEMRRPVAADDGVFVLIIALFAVVLAHLNRAGVVAGLNLGDLVGFFHPQVDEGHFAVTADDIGVAAGGGHAGDVDGIAAVDGVDDFVGVAVDDGHLTGITQSDDEVILPVASGLRLGRANFGRHEHVPGFLHLLERHFGRRGRLFHQVFGHNFDLTLGQGVLAAPIGHAAGGAVVDDGLQANLALGDGVIGGEGGTGGALAQRPMAAGAALEVGFLGPGELLFGQAALRGLFGFIDFFCLGNLTGGASGKQHQVADHGVDVILTEGLVEAGGHDALAAGAAGAILRGVDIRVDDGFMHKIRGSFGLTGVGVGLNDLQGGQVDLGEIGSNGAGGIGYAGDRKSVG